MTPDDDILATLRTALDELTDGTEPNDRAVAPLAVHGRRRWMLPAVAAAVAVVVVVASVAVVTTRDRGDGHPVAPTPSGPPITPVAPAMIPWYELDLAGARPSEPVAIGGTGSDGVQAWATDDYSRVLTASVISAPNASVPSDDWPISTPIEGVSGAAWRVSYPDERASWRVVYWAPLDDTAVIVSAYGFEPADLDTVLTQLRVARVDGRTVVVSPLSSLPPVGASAAADTEVSQIHAIEQTTGAADSSTVRWVTLMVHTSGEAAALATVAARATAMEAFATPFGPGFRADVGSQTEVWWQVDGSGVWAGVVASEDHIEEVLAAVGRVPDIEVPAIAKYTGDAPTTTPAPSSSTLPPVSNAPSPESSWAVLPAGRLPKLAIGESVMMSAASLLASLGISVAADEAEQASAIATRLERLRDGGQLGDVVVIQTGTNGRVVPEDMDRIMAAVADVPNVVVLTVHADRSWIGPNNDLIRSLPSTYPNVRIVDWDLIAQECAAECLTPDGIHLRSTAAAQIYVDAIIAAIDAG